MILGIGVDTAEIARFERSLRRTPALVTRLFAEQERMLPVWSLAARFAAKEALIKALGGDHGLAWHDMVIPAAVGGRPGFERTDALANVRERMGVSNIHLSLTHDGGMATAFVVVEGEPA